MLNGVEVHASLLYPNKTSSEIEEETMARTARELKPRRELEGLSKRQIEEHHDVLYKGYVNKLNEIEAAVPEADISKANATYSTLRELKREEVFTTNAIRL